MFRAYFYGLILCLALTLSACGGSSSSSDGSTVSAAEANYNGSRDPALLTRDNTLLFVQTLLGSSDLFGSDVMLRSTSGGDADTIVNGVLHTNHTLRQAVKQGLQTLYLQPRHVSVNETENCEFGGNVAVNGSLDDNTGRGTATYQFSDCKLATDLRLNGKLVMDIRAFDFSSLEPTSYILDFDNFNLDEGTTAASIVGTSDYITSGDGSRITQTMNLLLQDSDSDDERMLKDLTVLSNPAGVITQMSGKVYVHEYGYINVTSSDDLRLWSVVERGEILLKGAAQSVAKVHVYELGGDAYRVDLDANGDGVYELRSIQSAAGDSTGLGENRAPVVNISHPDPYYEDGFRIGDFVYLSGYSSYDPEGDAFSYVWSIEEKPADSAVEFSAYDPMDTQVESVTTTALDQLGDYKFSLKLTDASGASAISFVDITLVDSPPEISDLSISGTSSDRGNSFEAGRPVEVHPYITDDYDEHYGGNLTYIWELTHPAGSQAVLENSHESSAAFTPDLIGQYALKLTVTDSAGGVDVMTKAVHVVHTAPTAIIDLNQGNLIRVGDKLQLYGYGSGSQTDYDLDYLWTIDSAPAGSVATFSPDAREGHVAFTPDKTGTYRIGLTVTDDYGAEGTTYKNISVVAAE